MRNVFDMTLHEITAFVMENIHWFYLMTFFAALIMGVKTIRKEWCVAKWKQYTFLSIAGMSLTLGILFIQSFSADIPNSATRLISEIGFLLNSFNIIRTYIEDINYVYEK